MIDFVATETTYVVLPDLQFFGVVEPGQQFTTSQVVEQFTDEVAARERALAVGWTDEVDEPIEEGVAA